MASQAIDKCNTEAGAESALKELDTFVKTAEQLKLENPRDFRQNYGEVLTNDVTVSCIRKCYVISCLFGTFEQPLLSYGYLM